MNAVERVGKGEVDVGKTREGFGQSDEFLVEEVEDSGDVHDLELGAEAFEAFLKEAFALGYAMFCAAVVVTEASAAHGGRAALLAAGHNQGTKRGGFGCWHGAAISKG